MTSVAWPAPTHGSLRWVRRAMSVRGVEATNGIAELGSQRQLAAAMGMSPGTVNQHVRRLGPIVVNTAPVRVDVDELGRAVPCGRAPNGARWASRGPRPAWANRAGSPVPGEPPGSFDRVGPPASSDEARGQLREAVAGLLACKLRERLLPMIEAVVDEVDALLDDLIDQLVPNDPEVDPEVADPMPRGDESAARGTSARPSDRQTGFSPSDQEEPPGCLPDPDLPRAARRVAENVPRDEPRRGAARHDDAPNAPLTEREEVLAALAPIFEECRRRHLPADLDDSGVGSLQQLSIEELEAGVRNLLKLMRTGDYHRPLGFLVAKSRTGREFFTAPPRPEPPPPPIEQDPSPPVDDGPDPLEGLSDAELAAIDATIEGITRLPLPALMALRRQRARELRAAS